MDPDAASVAMLYQDPHPAHVGFAEAVDADLVDYRRLSTPRLGDSVLADVANGLAYPRYDVYLVEGSRPLYAALVRRFTSSSRLVYLCADHGFYDLGSAEFSGDTGLKSLLGRFGTPAVRAVAARGIDGVIAVSEFAASFTRRIVGGEVPLEVAHPYVQPDVYERLGAVTPDLSAPIAVTVGRADRYKGVDLLVDAWPAVRERHPDAELHVVGSGHPDSYTDTAGVMVHGFIEDLGAAFEKASLYVQPSRIDTFPVSVLEAMRAGLPPLVTSTTGTRSVAAEVDGGLVVEPTSAALADGGRAYFGRSPEDRRELSAASREVGSRFDEVTCKQAFGAAFRTLLEAL